MDSSIADVIKQATLHASSIDEIDRDKLHGILEEFSFARITGLVTPKEMDRARELMQARFDPANEGPTSGEHHHKVRQNYQKISIGRARHGGVDRPRFMRVFYNPLWAEDIYAMREPFRRLCAVRNILGSRRIDFATDDVEQGLWTAARIHLFPRGGGFMVAHQDTVLPAIYKRENAGEFYQPLLLMTRKGEDFQEGGGFAIVKGQRILYEDYCDKGDIAIYNTATVHGVEDIDTHLPYRHESLAGRMSALVTLYKDLD